MIESLLVLTLVVRLTRCVLRIGCVISSVILQKRLRDGFCRVTGAIFVFNS